MSTQEFDFSYNIPLDEEITYNTLVTPFEDGKEQRRKKWSSPKRTFSIQFNALQDSEADRLWNFYKSREGAYDTFYFENPSDSPISAETSTTVAIGTNGAFSFANYPWPSGDVVIYKNSVASGDEGIDWTVNRATGVVSFVAGYYPEAGKIISADHPFSYVVRFAEDKLSKSLFSYKLYSGQLKLAQVL